MDIKVNLDLIKDCGTEQAIIIEWLINIQIKALNEIIKTNEDDAKEIENINKIYTGLYEIGNNPLGIYGCIQLEKLQQEGQIEIDLNLVDTVITLKSNRLKNHLKKRLSEEIVVGGVKNYDNKEKHC